MAFLASIIGAILYRLRGWGPPEGTPAPWWKERPILQVLFALPYAIVTYPLGGLTIALIVLAFTASAVATGHASYIDLNSVKPGAPNGPKDGQVDEWYGTWIPWPGTYLHDFIGLIVSGLLISSPSGVSLILLGQHRNGLLVLLSGALKAPAYALGKFVPSFIWSDKDAVGEVLTGWAMWGSLAIIVGAHHVYV